MTRDEIVTALRCCAEPGRDCEEDCPMNEISREPCRKVLAPAAADLIENQQREIEALRWANGGGSGDKICRAALEAFGERAQMTMAIEEMSELAKELCKRCRGRDNVEAIAEEVADVQIMLQQLVILFDCKGAVDKYRQYKLERLAGRIEEVSDGNRRQDHVCAVLQPRRRDGRDQEQARAGLGGVDPSGAALRGGGAAHEKLYIPGEHMAHPGGKKDDAE